jgi:hypothetical protein
MRLDLLDLSLDIRQPLLDGECIRQALCLAQQRQQTILLGAEIFESRRGIHIVIRDILNRLVEIVQRAVVRLGVSREIGKDLRIGGCRHRKCHCDLIAIGGLFLIGDAR